MGGLWFSGGLAAFVAAVLLSTAGVTASGWGDPEIKDYQGDTDHPSLDIERVWFAATPTDGPDDLWIEMELGAMPAYSHYPCAYGIPGTMFVYSVYFQIYGPQGQPLSPDRTMIFVRFTVYDGCPFANVGLIHANGTVIGSDPVAWRAFPTTGGKGSISWSVDVHSQYLDIPVDSIGAGYAVRNQYATASGMEFPTDRAPDTGYGRAYAIPKGDAGPDEKPKEQPATVPPSAAPPGKQEKPADAADFPTPDVSALESNPSAKTSFTGSATSSAGLAITGIAVPLLALVSLAAWFLRFQLAYLVVAPFFSRIERHEALAHERRALLVEYVKANPGASYGQVRRETGIGSGPLMHHLRVLQRTGHLRVVREGARTRLFPPGAAVEEGPVLSAIQRRVLGAVSREPGISQERLARRLGVGRTNVAYHVQRLKAAGRLSTRRERRGVRHFPV